MTRFEDGPAAGRHLMLHHSPTFLRVTHVPQKVDHAWDALDQPGDTPREHEQIMVYVRRGSANRCFVDFAGKGGRRQGGCFSAANYRYYLPQPPDDVARDPQKWIEWCRRQEAQLFA